MQFHVNEFAGLFTTIEPGERLSALIAEKHNQADRARIIGPESRRSSIVSIILILF
jgi:hypothetical protein